MVYYQGEDTVTGSEVGQPTEYFCTECHQLRLSLIADKSKCGNCGSKAIIAGHIRSLDKSALLKQYRK